MMNRRTEHWLNVHLRLYAEVSGSFAKGTDLNGMESDIDVIVMLKNLETAWNEECL